MLNRRALLQGTLSLSGLAGLRPATAKAAGADGWSEVPKILARIRPPSIPRRTFPITGFGARSNRDCSAAIASAIAAAAKAGGGRVEVPAGHWRSGPIHLKSHVELHLAKGAVVKFLSNAKAYLPVVETRWQGIPLLNYSPLIYAKDQHDIAVTGAGTFDGGADTSHWWPWKGSHHHGWWPGMPSQRKAEKRLEQMCDAQVPLEKRVFGEGSYLRPGFFEPLNCRNVLIEGVKIERMPFWQVHPIGCDNVIVRGLHVGSHKGPNTDGCDPESCTNVLIEDCFFHTGDDCIAVKSGRNADGRRLHAPSKNIVIRNCRMVSGHGGIAIGSGISGGASHIYAENCTMSGRNLRWAILIKDNCARGGALRHIRFRHITIGEVARAAIWADFHYGAGRHGDFTPVLDDVVIADLSCRKCAAPWVLRGMKKAPLGHFTLRHCRFDQPVRAARTQHAPYLKLVDVKVAGKRV